MDLNHENKELKTALSGRLDLITALTKKPLGGNICLMSTRQEVFKHVCRKCKEAWQSYVKRPKKCPYCQSRKWNEPK